MSDLLAEVDEVMRQERFEKFIKDYGKIVLAFILSVIIITGAISGYKTWNNSVNASGTDQLLTLLDSKDFPDSIKDADLKMRPPLRGIGLITAAGAFVAEGKTNEAITLYKRVIDDKSIPNIFRDLAVLMYIRLGENDDVQIALMRIQNNKKSPWRYHAHLEAASLYANKDQDFEKASMHLNKIQDAENLPETLYDTARALNQVYALKQQNKIQQEKVK
ncbi:MAG: hypothetical protein KAJ86_00645 [Alphaproteobacteria bacterium]|nr:hypothetical protein [Alphaproteobacteria bacterium]